MTAADRPAVDVPGPLPTGVPRDALVAEVARVLGALPDGARLVVAVSGGPDSTALAYLIADARPDLAVTLAHVRHGLRDDHDDLTMVRQHATWLGLPLLIREVEVVAGGHGTEAAAREARYAALDEVARSVRARWLAVGHTADDQAETVLLRAARGTGIDGLAGMAAVSGTVVRPLLRLRRSDVHRFLLLEGLPSVTDPTNEDPAVRRATVRHEVLPALGRVGADPVAALARLAELARDDAAALEGWARDVVRDRVRSVGPVASIEDRELDRLPPAVARRVLRRMVAAAAPTRPGPSAASVARVAALHAGGAVDLPHGLRATAAGGRRAVGPQHLPVSDATTVAWPGVTAWTPAAVELRVIVPEPGEGQLALAMPGVWTPPEVRDDTAALPPGGVAGRLHLAVPAGLGALRLRHRADGDRIRGPAGTHRLKDVLIDAGVPRAVRSLWPVVVDARGRIVWVPGLAADADVLTQGRQAPVGLLVLGRPRRDRDRAGAPAAENRPRHRD